ncbi:MAG: PAS domain-containing protein, partial [Saprospiraceae bacterium]|nr:PAS domain-containing protein [Saprospiraceae bacterium]
DKIRVERTFQQEQHYFLDRLIQALPVSILILDYDDNISEFNPKAERILGLTEKVIGKPLKKLGHPLVSTLTQLQENDPITIRTEGIKYYRCFANKFMHKGFPRKFVVIQELSGEILATEKKAYGKVIRMMAHEVNNSIGAINSILNSLISHEKIEEEEVKEYLPIIIERNDRLSLFMKNFAKVVRLPEPDKSKIDLSKLVSNVFQLMKVKLGAEDVTYDLKLPKNAVRIQADKEQLEQALINIIKNACEAIEGSGTIKAVLTDKPVQLRIMDNGKGLSADVSEQVFTPFFSTKQDGQGIGLTLVREILFNHNCQFSLESKDGWTTFEIDF